MNNYYTVGVAGHIDHGKTSLTKRLTGVDTDRLKEEKERNISIELGFAPLVLPSGKKVGVVDVPGHEKFIRQMIAGAAGIDLVLLVIAADEGIMPQTREHFDIIRFLGIERGIIVLSKRDLVEVEWLEMVHEEMREWSQGSFLEEAPIIPVSSHTGEGVEDLLQAIDDQLLGVPQRNNEEPFRLPVDRVFTKKGAGAVVTGTIYEGTVTEGDVVEVFPLGEKVKVRQINVHHSQVKTAYAGQRAAINLSGIDFKDMERGYSLTAPDYFQKTNRIDVALSVLPDLGFKLKQRARLRLHMATTEVMGKVIFFDRNECEPGDEVLCQILLEEEVIAKPGDPFILRRLSPTATIGGGQILSPYGVQRKFGEQTMKVLSLLQNNDDWSLLQYILSEHGFAEITSIDQQLAIGMERLKAMIQKFEEEEQLRRFGEYIVERETLQQWTDAAKKTLMTYHQAHPIRLGIKKSELRSKSYAQLPDKLWREYIQWLRANHIIEEIDETLKLRTHVPKIPDGLVKKVDTLRSSLKQDGLLVTEWMQAASTLGITAAQAVELRGYFLERGILESMGPEFMVDQQVYAQTVKTLYEHTKTADSFSTPQVKEILGISRKYLIPFLESLDEKGYTKRQENERIWLKLI
jgi:selenocysteine-specific elongation factor